MSRFSFSYQNTKALSSEAADTVANNTVFYTLSVTTEVSVSEPASVTKYPVEDGSSVVDNFIVDNRVVSFNGLITDIEVLGKDSNPSVFQWISDIRALRQNKQLVTVNIHSLESIPNCVITSFNITKNKTHGLSGWDCSMQFTEVDVSERAKLVEVKVPKKEVKGKVEGKSNESDSSTKLVLTDAAEAANRELLAKEIAEKAEKELASANTN